MSSKSIYNFLGPKRFYHFIFWAIAVISHMVDHICVIDKAGVLPYLGLVLERNGLLMAIVYFNFYILIPKLYPVNRIIYSLILVACMMIFAVVHGHYRVWLFNTYNIGNYENWGELSYNLLANFLNAGRFVLISVLLKFTVDWFDQQKELTQAKVDKLQVELKYLKNQINPHFLFNTLNSMYALSLKKSDKTPDMILRLSEMMEYMLYDSNEEKVRLVKDIEHLDNYIQLELIRTNDVKFIFSKHGEIKEQLIAPLLLLPLVENAFKHGLSRVDPSAYARASLTVKNDLLTFEIENNKIIPSGETANGIGLINLEKRLNHLYHQKHSLQITDTDDTFRASLQISLS